VELVAIAELSGPAEAATGPLAEALGTTAYELRLVLNAGLPAVVLATIDSEKARAAASAITRCGHAAVTCDRASLGRMTVLRAFRLEPSGIVADANSTARLQYDEIGALLRAMHRSTSERTEKVTERKVQWGMLAVTGIPTTKKTSREVTTRSTEHEQALYIFPRSGGPAWVLLERGANYTGLGPNLRPSSMENFLTVIRLLRERAPSAAYDERLMSGRPIRGVAEGADAAGLLAHLLAAHLCR
jgi:hypothetical protein